MDKLLITGNLGADAEIREVNGMNAIGFPVAVDKSYKDKSGEKISKVKWYKCTIWRKPDNSKIADYLKKGVKVLIDGEVESEAYTDKQGQLQSNLKVRVDRLEFMQAAKAESSPEQKQERAVYSSEELDDLPF